MRNKYPQKVIILGLLNGIWIAIAFSMVFSSGLNPLLILSVGIPFLLATIFLFRQAKWSFFILLIIYLAFGIELRFSAVSWSAYFGPVVFIHIMNSPIGANPFAILLLLILIKSRSWIMTKEMGPNQRVEPIVKTSGDSVEEQASQAHP